MLSRTSRPVAVAAASLLWLVVSTSAPPAYGDARADPLASDADADAVAAAAMAVLEKHCARCHGGPQYGGDGDEGGFAHVLDPAELAADGQVVPFDPDGSALLARVRGGEMPPAKVAVRPSADDIEALRRWIAAGARPAAARAGAPREFITQAQVDGWMEADLERHSRGRQRHLRYVTLVHLYNAGSDDAELEMVRAGLIRLLNSLTWSSRVVVPQAIDRAATVYRIDLEELGWSHRTWETIAKSDPYAVVRRTAPARAVRTATRTLVPAVRADWLVASASRPPLYHEILDIPDQVEELERRLSIDAERDVRAGQVVRAGFNGSGVSQHNRVIERHGLPGGGYYWRSYDFKNSTGTRNIFEFPLDFRPDGGEIIFSLPNGFQGYMLADASGRRIDKAPTDIVVDPARSDSAVVNGLSCMGCHDRGIIAKKDEIRGHLRDNRRAFSRRVVDHALRVYAPGETLDALYERDRGSFTRAVRQAGGQEKGDPINVAARLFEADLALPRAAAELGFEPVRLDERLAYHPALRRKLGSLLVPGGSAKRDAFVAVFDEAARTLGIGLPVATLRGHERLELDCEAGSGSACLGAGQAFNGGAAGTDHARAVWLFGEACRLGQAEGCRQFGHLLYRGHGTRRDRARAVLVYQRGCDLGSGLSCGHAAYAHSRGHGVRPDSGLAVIYYGRACDLGTASSCLAAGRHYYHGSGVSRDRRVAAGFFERACDGGVADACRDLGHQYRWGLGVTVDWVESYNAFRRGCDLGDKEACAEILDLGTLLEFP